MNCSPKHCYQALAIVLFFVGGGYLGLNASPEPKLPVDAPLLLAQKEGQRAQTSRVRLEHADVLSYDASLQRGLQRLVGNVRFVHGNATMDCDSAYLNDDEQTFVAMGDVHMVQGDTVNIYARYLHYDGFTKLARLRNEVRLENSTTQVFTDSLDYDRVADLAYYFDGGTVVDAQNTLTSDYGQYHPKTHDAEFRYNVHLVNDSTDMRTEILYYNTNRRIGRYEGTTEIKSDSGLIVSTRGAYDLANNVGILLDRSEVYSGDRILLGDSIYYDGTTRFGEAFGRMELHDTLQRSSLYGDYGYFDAERSYAFATSRAYAMDYSQSDTLYVGADTLELISFVREREATDSLPVTPADSMERHLRGYHQVRVWRRDAQAVADSLTYSSVDSLLILYGRPTMWSQERQITGDTIQMLFKERQLDHSDVKGRVLAIEQMADEPSYFNQLSGAHLRAYIQDSTVRQIDITEGEVESIFYMKDEKAGTYSGVNRMTSSAMHVSLDSGQIQKVLWLGEVKAKVYPMEMAVGDAITRLAGFAWLDSIRPQSKEDVISQDSTLASYTLAGLRRFRGAEAALLVYKPYEEAKARRKAELDSISSLERSEVNTPSVVSYQYVLRPDDTDEPTKNKYEHLLLPTWLYNPFSDPESQEPSSISISTGMPARKPSTEE